MFKFEFCERTSKQSEAKRLWHQVVNEFQPNHVKCPPDLLLGGPDAVGKDLGAVGPVLDEVAHVGAGADLQQLAVQGERHPGRHESPPNHPKRD